MRSILTLPDGRQTEVEVNESGVILDAINWPLVYEASAQGIVESVDDREDWEHTVFQMPHVQLSFADMTVAVPQ